MSERPPAGSLFVVSGPSGVGKTSLVKTLIEQTPRLLASVSYTTRKARPGEAEGIDYFFVDDQQFDVLAATDQFLEHARVFGNRYGTSRQWAVRHLEAGNSVLLEIDWQGARQVKTAYADAVTMMVLPPSLERLEERLRRRNQDDEVVIARRMQAATNEMNHYLEFDYLIVNETFEAAVEELGAVVRAAALRRGTRSRWIEQHLPSLRAGTQP